MADQLRPGADDEKHIPYINLSACLRVFNKGHPYLFMVRAKSE